MRTQARQREARHARRYRLLRVEVTGLIEELRARAAQPAGQLMLPGPVADRLQRALDRGAFGEQDE